MEKRADEQVTLDKLTKNYQFHCIYLWLLIIKYVFIK